jgi:hypothetical protein
MVRNRNALQMIGVLAVVALAATVVALGLQRYFGRLPVLVLFGQVLAVTGAAAYALWLNKSR